MKLSLLSILFFTLSSFVVLERPPIDSSKSLNNKLLGVWSSEYPIGVFFRSNEGDFFINKERKKNNKQHCLLFLENGDLEGHNIVGEELEKINGYWEVIDNKILIIRYVIGGDFIEEEWEVVDVNEKTLTYTPNFYKIEEHKGVNDFN